MTTRPYLDFEELELTFLGATKKVYKKGKGPAIIVMHEIPGLYPEVVDFARKIEAEGFTVYLPSLIGIAGKPFTVGYSLASIAKSCVSKEFTVWATQKNSPIVDWLRELGTFAHKECGGIGIGAIGMCLTGGFALGMMVSPEMLAPVLSQPSLPFAVFSDQKRDLGVSPETLLQIKKRVQEEDVCVLGLRFTHDRLVPKERFQRLKEELGGNFISIEIDSSKQNKHGISRIAHSVVSKDFVDQKEHPTFQALQTVIQFYKQKLCPTS